jgi:hypothetical protein
MYCIDNSIQSSYIYILNSIIAFIRQSFLIHLGLPQGALLLGLILDYPQEFFFRVFQLFFMNQNLRVALGQTCSHISLGVKDLAFVGPGYFALIDIVDVDCITLYVYVDMAAFSSCALVHFRKSPLLFCPVLCCVCQVWFHVCGVYCCVCLRYQATKQYDVSNNTGNWKYKLKNHHDTRKAIPRNVQLIMQKNNDKECQFR